MKLGSILDGSEENAGNTDQLVTESSNPFFCFSSGTCSAEIWLSVNTDRCRIFIDGANPSFIRALKDRVDEDTNYQQWIVLYKLNYPSVYDLQFLQQNMFVIPVPLVRNTRTCLHTVSRCQNTAMAHYLIYSKQFQGFYCSINVYIIIVAIQNYEINQINVPNAIRITALMPPLLSCRSSSSSYICNFSLIFLVACWKNAWQLESSSVIAC